MWMGNLSRRTRGVRRRQRNLPMCAVCSRARAGDRGGGCAPHAATQAIAKLQAVSTARTMFTVNTNPEMSGEYAQEPAKPNSSKRKPEHNAACETLKHDREKPLPCQAEALLLKILRFYSIRGPSKRLRDYASGGATGYHRASRSDTLPRGNCRVLEPQRPQLVWEPVRSSRS